LRTTFSKRPKSSGGRVLLAHEDDVNAGAGSCFPHPPRENPGRPRVCDDWAAETHRNAAKTWVR